MQNYWTSKKPIKGLRHFVLINEVNDNGLISLLMVSVLDGGICTKISKQELLNKENWEEGWLDLPKRKSITGDYLKYKLINNQKDEFKMVFINENSIFNIS